MNIDVTRPPSAYSKASNNYGLGGNTYNQTAARSQYSQSVAGLNKGTINFSWAALPPQGSSDFTNVLNQIRAGQPATHLDVQSFDKQYLMNKVGDLHSSAKVQRKQGSQRPQTAHIRNKSATLNFMPSNLNNYVAENSFNFDPVQYHPDATAQVKSLHHRTQSLTSGIGRPGRLMSAAAARRTKKNGSAAQMAQTQSVAEIVALGTDHGRSGPFAQKAYRTPGVVTEDILHAINKGNAAKIKYFEAKAPKVNVIQQEALRKKGIPASNVYTQHKDWKGENAGRNFQKFLKAEKVTFTQRILATKKDRIPGPSTYKPKYDFVKKKVQQVPKSDTDQLVMLDTAKWASKQVPGHKYKLQKELLEERSAKTLIYPRQRIKGQQIKGSRSGSAAVALARKKTNDPAPGTYEEGKCIEKTQRHKIEWGFLKGKRVTEFDKVVNNKKGIVGVGHYANAENAFDRCLSSPPTSLKRRR